MRWCTTDVIKLSQDRGQELSLMTQVHISLLEEATEFFLRLDRLPVKILQSDGCIDKPTLFACLG